MDEKKVRFKGKLISAALRKNASVEDSEARGFVDALYSEWVGSGASLDELPAWLDMRLSGEFRALNSPPVWVEEEPAWPFLDGKPMVFLSQTKMDETAISASLLSPGETVYLFGARQVAGRGFRMIYRTVSQFEES